MIPPLFSTTRKDILAYLGITADRPWDQKADGEPVDCN